MEIITGVERRRRWRLEEKLEIVAEVEQPGACLADVARRHDVSLGLLWNWRRQVRSGSLVSEVAPMFTPVLSKRKPIPTFHGFELVADIICHEQNMGRGGNGRGLIRGT